MEKEIYSYEITKEETRKRNSIIIQLLRIILPLGLLLGLLIAILTGGYDKNLSSMYYSLIFFFFVIFARTALINRYYPYADRSYSMDESGITISKGKKVKRYAWKELEDYFVLGDRIQASGRDARKSGDCASGRVSNLEIQENCPKILDFKTTFYLNPKRYGWGKIMKKYIIVYGEDDNSEKVNQVLASYLRRRKMEGKDEVGFMSYEFK